MRIDNYDITSDGNQFIVNEVKVNTNKESKNYQKEMLVNPNYFTSVSGLLSHIAKNELMVSVNTFDTIDGAVCGFKSSLAAVEHQIKDLCGKK